MIVKELMTGDVSPVAMFVYSYLKLLLCLLKTLCIRWVDNVDEDVGVVKVVPPVGPDPSLPANVPDVQSEAWRLDGLDVEALGGGDGGDVFTGEAL